MENSSTAHAVLMPFPAQGHINPMMNLAKMLNHNGFHITFVNTEIIHRRILRSEGPARLAGTETFRFKKIPDGLHYETEDSVHVDPGRLNSYKDHLPVSFRQLVSRLNEAEDSPPITCIISDGFLSFNVDVAHELGVPSVLLWPQSASATMAYAHMSQLIRMGLVPPKEGSLDTVINWIPGMEGIQLKDLPITFDFDISFQFFNGERANQASANIVNTFDAMEPNLINKLKLIFPNLCCLGPLHLLQTTLPENGIKYLTSNTYKENEECLKWLDSKQPNSVILVNFGTTGKFTAKELTEIACGLAHSKQNFLWVIRSTLVSSDSAMTTLPSFLACHFAENEDKHIYSEYEEEIKERGFLATWCNQERVLNHPAIGGFLTHCGWNSVLEGVCAGVPMIFCPTFADQMTNFWYLLNHVGIALGIGGEVNRDNIERVVRELMIGERGKELKQEVLKLKILAEEACSIKGSSHKDFEKLTQVLLSKVST